MRFYDIIAKKRHGYRLSKEEIEFAVSEYTSGRVPDYQMSALLMAICTVGMEDCETVLLTAAIAASGDSINLDCFGSLSVDKHSTGGVGDKTTPVVASIAAAVGCKVAKMSGRGLGHTGGTVDKLECIPGYRISLSSDEFLDTVRRVGVAVVGQSGELAPADKKIYALRDVTATVDSIPLIASSIMGKKLAAGAHSIVLDVKFGSGSFMKTPEAAKELAETMVNIGKRNGRATSAIITNMDAPLGHAVGNILEIKEAVATLRGEGPSDLTEICLALSAEMASLALGISETEASRRANEALRSGAAYEKFKEWIGAQGGDLSYVEFPEKFDTAPMSLEITAPEDSYISYMDTEKIGLCSVSLGAGRTKKGDAIDNTAGIIILKKTGERVRRGEVIARLYSSDGEKIGTAAAQLRSALKFSQQVQKRARLIYEILR